MVVPDTDRDNGCDTDSVIVATELTVLVGVVEPVVVGRGVSVAVAECDRDAVSVGVGVGAGGLTVCVRVPLCV